MTTQAVALPVLARVDQSRFPEADPRPAETTLTKLGDTELPEGSFGQQRELEELFCKRILSGQQQMAFSEQQASAARPSQIDPTARNEAR